MQEKTIELTQGKTAIIDADDFERVSKFKWTTRKASDGSFRAFRNVYVGNKRKAQMLEQFILPPIPGFIIDHVNNNPLDNRKSNLRYATAQENSFNRKCFNPSGFKGVTWFERTKSYQARICRNGKSKFLGYHKSIVDAAKAYDKAAKELFGEFANLNFPEEV